MTKRLMELQEKELDPRYLGKKDLKKEREDILCRTEVAWKIKTGGLDASTTTYRPHRPPFIARYNEHLILGAKEPMLYSQSAVDFTKLTPVILWTM